MMPGEAHNQFARSRDPGNSERRLDSGRAVDMKTHRIHAGHGVAEFFSQLNFTMMSGGDLHPQLKLR